MVKAQIHAGGRGKGKFKEADAGEAGGVRLAKSVGEAAEQAKKMLGRTLVTHQTGPVGKQVNRIYIEDGSGIETELYLALLVDRQTSRVSFVCSTEGGMDIEEVAASTPEKILNFTVDPATGAVTAAGTATVDTDNTILVSRFRLNIDGTLEIEVNDTELLITRLFAHDHATYFATPGAQHVSPHPADYISRQPQLHPQSPCQADDPSGAARARLVPTDPLSHPMCRQAVNRWGACQRAR